MVDHVVIESSINFTKSKILSTWYWLMFAIESNTTTAFAGLSTKMRIQWLSWTLIGKYNSSQLFFHSSLFELTKLVNIDCYPCLDLEIFSSKIAGKNWVGKKQFLPPLLNCSLHKNMNPLITSQPMYSLF